MAKKRVRKPKAPTPEQQAELLQLTVQRLHIEMTQMQAEADAHRVAMAAREAHSAGLTKQIHQMMDEVLRLRHNEELLNRRLALFASREN